MPALAPPKILSVRELRVESQAPVLCISTPSGNVRRMLHGPQDWQLASPVSFAELIPDNADHAPRAVKAADDFIADRVFVW